MKNYSIYLLPVAALTLIGSLAITGAVLLVTVLTASHIGDELPMFYLEKLSLPALSIIVPIIGMLVFAAILPSLFSRRKVADVKPANRAAVSNQQSVEHMKAA